MLNLICDSVDNCEYSTMTQRSERSDRDVGINRFLVQPSFTIKDALVRLNTLGANLNLFVVESNGKLLGSVTDGDIRRGLINDASLSDPVSFVMNSDCSVISDSNIGLREIIELRRRQLRILPMVNGDGLVTGLLNFKERKTILPVDAVVMAGGKGMRLLPLTLDTPKPLLPVGGKPILSYSLDRLLHNGIGQIFITVNYLRHRIEEFISQNYNSNCVRPVVEEKPLGTIGAISLINEWTQDYILLTNSDLLTNIDYEDFFLDFIESGADMMIAAIPYPVRVPYAILDTSDRNVSSFIEKPEYTFYANAGIYLFKRELLSLIPQNEFFNTTDLMQKLIEKGGSLKYYPLLSYWLDIGSHDDYRKAQSEFKHLAF